MVNFGMQIYLTDFLKRTFGGENAKNRDFCGEKNFKSGPVYHFRINYAAALRKSAHAVVRGPSQRRARHASIPGDGDDNYHYMDESERYEHGTYDAVDEALAVCRAIVEQSLKHGFTPGMTAEGLFTRDMWASATTRSSL
ncbi:MAG: hypothetical protein ACLQF2_16045 [Rhodomicrobium sp.]